MRRAERGGLSNLRDGIPGRTIFGASPIYNLGQASRYNCDMGLSDSGRDSYLSPMLPISYLATLLIKHQPCNGGAAETGCWGIARAWIVFGIKSDGAGMEQAWSRQGEGREKA